MAQEKSNPTFRLRSAAPAFSAAFALAMGLLCTASRADTLAAKDQEALDFLIQKVCTDHSGNVVAADPYHCPAGGGMRALRPSEPLPYHRFDQPLADRPDARQRRDSFPVTLRDGQIEVVSTFDHAPFDRYKPDRDGYSLAVVRDGWASSAGTRSRELGTTFFGADCKPYNGWIYFPVAAMNGKLIDKGEASLPIALDHWEKNGEAWPGRCPTAYISEWVTSWEPLPRFVFGGPGTESQKTIDAIRSIHGFTDRPSFLAKGHMEIFYFTRLYGFTRWETWISKQRYDAEPGSQQLADRANSVCTGAQESIYRGVPFERTGCRDWTSVEVLSKSDLPPAWPIPGNQ